MSARRASVTMPSKAVVREKATSWSFWSSSVTEDVEMPTIHLVALVVYTVLMGIYIVYASISFANYERPVLFESQETKLFDAVPLNFTIDCRDCRRFPSRSPDSSLWTLSWDYSSLPGGCAARSPALFDDTLRSFCAAQQAASLTRNYYSIPYAGCPPDTSTGFPLGFLGFANGFGVFPGPQGLEQCQAKCDTTPTCKAFIYATDVVKPLARPTDRPTALSACQLKLLSCWWPVRRAFGVLSVAFCRQHA